MTSPYDPPPDDDSRTREGQWSPPPGHPPPYPRPTAQSVPVLSIIGFVCAAIALLIIPILFGLAGIVLGIVGHSRGEALGKWAAITSAIAMILGMVLGYLLVANMS